MKKCKILLSCIFLFVCVVISHGNVKAYVIGENEPKILEIQFTENGKILKTSDKLHIRFKTENIDCTTYYKCRVLFTAHVSNRVDDITVECTYDPSTGYYQGESIPISKETMGETKYIGNFYGFYNQYPGIYGNILTEPMLSFVYSDNCYAGRHVGGESTCLSGAACSVCGTVYGNIQAHEFSDWKIYKATCTSDGIKTRACKKCAFGQAVTIPKLNHKASGWKVISAPSGKKAGLKQKTCVSCGKIMESKKIPKTIVKLNASSIPLQLKKSSTALKVISISNGDSVKSWTSSNKKIVSVNSKTGKIAAKRVGKAKITVTTKTGAKATCVVTVQKSGVKTKKLSVRSKSISIKKGKSYKISVSRNPITANDKITYKSSNKKIATVDSKGKVKAKKKGVVTITIRSASGEKAKVKIIVK